MRNFIYDQNQRVNLAGHTTPDFIQIKEEPFDYEILVMLRLYAEHHFSLEEAYMAELNYPQAEGHMIAAEKSSPN